MPEIKNENLHQIYLNELKTDKSVPDSNKKLIISFFNEKVAKGVKPSGLCYYIKILLRVSRTINKPFEKITKDELINFFVNLKPEPILFKTKYSNYYRQIDEYSQTTLQLYKSSTKTFWHWMMKGKKIKRDEKGFPLTVSWISFSDKNVKKKFKQDVLSREEVNKMIKLASNPRDKALIAVLFETGMRVGELLGMKINEIEEMEGYAQTVIDGKTGSREVVFVKSLPFLQDWLNWIKENQEIISDKAKPFVWISFPKVGIKRRHFLKGGKVIDLDAINAMIKHTAQKAGITKRVWTHGFRHSSATDFARQGYNETEMRLKFGWTEKSDIPSNYTHYKFNDLKNKMLHKSGKAVEVECADGNILFTKECPFCSHENPSGSKYCGKCSRPLNIETIKQQEKSQIAYQFMNNIINKIGELEKKGIPLQKVNEAIGEWVNTK
ncbi:tyrosine-type recombinase/integrase [Candidatus Micrarchaeota archaeon]|nr:tyrosine-type recombinase/integrase [Candidatus Micrarchaeota archaeon]